MSIPATEQVSFTGAQPVSGTVSLGAGAAAIGQVSLFRDSAITAQVSSSAAAPAGGATIATVTPGTAGLWEVTFTTSVLGTTVAAADSSNMELFQTATARLNPISYIVPGVTGAPFQSSYPPLILNLSAADTVNIKAIGAATAGSVYAATIVCRRIG